jgi:hypothetical protein
MSSGTGNRKMYLLTREFFKAATTLSRPSLLLSGTYLKINFMSKYYLHGCGKSLPARPCPSIKPCPYG